jgi:drug/metabolite transporter (DMT)-like permease
MNHVWHLWNLILRFAERMGPQEWFWVLAAMILVAVVCMRGFGSRSQY